MMKVVFIADDFQLRTPVQQLLDRFLIGYPYEGRVHKPDCEVVLAVANKNDAVERRIKDFGLRWESGRLHEYRAYDGELIFTLSHAPTLPRFFRYGASSSSTPGVAGTAVRGAWLLPSINLSKLPRVTKGLAIVQGPNPLAEVEALDALLPLIWSSTVPQVGKVMQLGENNFWDVLKRDFWPLVKSAISRSDSPQGDPVLDGRTQDLVGLGLLEKLVKTPRGWLVELADGFQFAIAVMDGALADYNVAVQTRAGGILSAQVHRPPAPAEHHYSRLAAMLEHYFRTGVPPWPVEQNILVAELLGRFQSADKKEL
jgi:hypothetical protein